ncbi:hypothetical protein RM572_17615 [Streptomyces sp. DSM 42041]|uniref:Uncharacterized protein n=1 Tax=Streptomyces hazeniae TaxID=3075538 RepID=A0ABU2NUB9_9ACTN|nr:hypothetical protein [Streptomyces sp. DSM 42041]MDT0380574.1 hypothetical protein [Streptomyces sp. DSM 42041]
MSAEERVRPRAWHQSPSMSELLASCAAADAVSRPPRTPDAPAAEAEQEAGTARPAVPQVRRDAA